MTDDAQSDMTPVANGDGADKAASAIPQEALARLTDDIIATVRDLRGRAEALHRSAPDPAGGEALGRVVRLTSPRGAVHVPTIPVAVGGGHAQVDLTTLAVLEGPPTGRVVEDQREPEAVQHATGVVAARRVDDQVDVAVVARLVPQQGVDAPAALDPDVDLLVGEGVQDLEHVARFGGHHRYWSARRPRR